MTAIANCRQRRSGNKEALVHQQLIPEELLQRSRKILFISHLAIGDFTYLQNFFHAFSRKYPHLDVDLWVDEVRRTWWYWRWPHLRRYALYDWLDQCSCFARIYRRTYSPPAYLSTLRDARSAGYPIVVTLATLRPHQYARLARRIAPSGFIVGMVKRTRPWKVVKNRAFSRLDGRLSEEKTWLPPISHVTDMYAHWFERLCGLAVAPEQRRPFITVPASWTERAQQRFPDRPGPETTVPAACRRLFVNPYAKDKKRCWPLPLVHRFLEQLKQTEPWKETRIIVNAPPESLKKTAAFFRTHPIDGIDLYTADENFFQLPAALTRCDLVVTVETSVMHLASALAVPTLALMRQKNPEWAPLNRERCRIIVCRTRKDWIEDITSDEVARAADEFWRTLAPPSPADP